MAGRDFRRGDDRNESHQALLPQKLNKLTLTFQSANVKVDLPVTVRS
jgi:hypothetical protein